MTEYMTEQEQIEQLKAWIKQYGLTVIAGIVMAFVLVTGWRYWEQYQNNILVSASTLYDTMLENRLQNNSASTTNTTAKAKELQTTFPKTPYASFAALMLAREATLNKNYTEANQQLTWVINHSKIAALREIARLRMARIAIAEKKPEAALETLNNIEDKTFSSLIAEIKGDAYIQMDDKTKARESYQFALQQLPAEEQVERPLLQMKLDNIAA